MTDAQVLTRGFDTHEARKDNPALVSRWLFSQSLLAHPEVLQGARIYCCICGQVTSLAAIDPLVPVDAREGLHCMQCGMSARQPSFASPELRIAALRSSGPVTDSPCARISLTDCRST